jgi:hypothetical protein
MVEHGVGVGDLFTAGIPAAKVGIELRPACGLETLLTCCLLRHSMILSVLSSAKSLPKSCLEVRRQSSTP